MTTKNLIVGALLASASAMSSAAIVGQLASATVLANGSNQFTGSLSAPQTGDLYLSFDIAFLTGTIHDNDFVALWLDNGATSGDHTTRPNIGLKPNLGPGGADYFVRTTGTGGAFAASPQAAVGQSVSLFGHLYKTGGSAVYNRYDLWVGADLSDLPALLASTPHATYSGASSGLGSIANFGVRAANLDAGDAVRIDGLVIRNSVPEPSALALALLGLAGAAAARRRAG